MRRDGSAPSTIEPREHGHSIHSVQDAPERLEPVWLPGHRSRY